MKNRISAFDALCIITLVSFAVIGHFYTEKYYPQASPSKKIIISNKFTILGMLVLIIVMFIGLFIKKWWQKKYPPKTNSTDSEVIDNNPPKDGNITE